MSIGQLVKKVSLYLYLTPHTKLNSKSISDLNVKSKTVQVTEEYTGNVDNLDVGKVL